jgi:soluble lytic murein transglycosylase-like protein
MLDSLKYTCRLLYGLGWSPPRPGRVALLLIVAGAVLLGTAAVYGSEQRAEARAASADALTERAQQVAHLLDQVDAYYADRLAPLERVLLGYRSDDRQLVRRIAVSLDREARRTGLEPRLLLAVLLVENPWLDPEARSPVGAQGLMQVMPLHRGKWKPCAPRLEEIESNICHGAAIFAAYLKEERGNVDRALLRYNGCVRGTNTPSCHQYPNHVYARAGRASLLAWRNLGTMPAAP